MWSSRPPCGFCPHPHQTDLPVFRVRNSHGPGRSWRWQETEPRLPRLQGSSLRGVGGTPPFGCGAPGRGRVTSEGPRSSELTPRGPDPWPIALSLSQESKSSESGFCCVLFLALLTRVMTAQGLLLGSKYLNYEEEES